MPDMILASRIQSPIATADIIPHTWGAAKGLAQQ
jgi:hypothetical protein